MQRRERLSRPSPFAALALLVLLAGPVLGQSAHVNPPVYASIRLKLSADFEAATVKKDAPAFIRLRLENVDIDTVWLIDTGGYHDYGFTITDASGMQPQQTQFGLSLPQMPILRSTGFPLMRGQEETATLDLAKLYVLPPGRYQVQVFRRLILPRADEDWASSEERAFSNRVELIVVG